jgi:methylase of polypeptide subunit release factors
MNAHPVVEWTENGQPHRARWRSENGAASPARIVVADDRIKADTAYRLVCEGTAILWRGDYHNARQLLQALSRRIERKRDKRERHSTPPPPQAFHEYRLGQSQRARTLGMLLVPVDPGHRVALGRAPDVREACTEAYGAADESYVVSLRELLGVIGAFEWRRKGVAIPALGASIHPHYGVFSPVRGEYLDLVNDAPLPALDLAFDIGTGTGVIAAILARRGLRHVVASDCEARALACARENLERLGLSDRVDVVEADLFPEGKASLAVCNPPWIPARAVSSLETAVYDPDSRMLNAFLTGLTVHLQPGGEGWLILSDFAEHLGLRTRQALLDAFDAAGLVVIDRLDTRPRHRRAADPDDPLHAARAAETTSLWRLKPR